MKYQSRDGSCQHHGWRVELECLLSPPPPVPSQPAHHSPSPSGHGRAPPLLTQHSGATRPSPHPRLTRYDTCSVGGDENFGRQGSFSLFSSTFLSLSLSISGIRSGDGSPGDATIAAAPSPFPLRRSFTSSLLSWNSNGSRRLA